MPNATVRANSPALPETTNRRAVLGGVLAAGAFGATAALPACAAPGPVALSAADRRVLDLWNRRGRMLAARDRISEEIDAAAAQLPGWARPGPKRLFVTGKAETPWLSFDGDTGWPEIADLDQQLAACAPGEEVFARPNAMDLCAQFQRKWRGLETDIDEARHKLMRALVALDERLTQKRAEEERTGYARLRARSDACTNKIVDIEDAIGKHVEASVLALGASLMIGIQDNDEEEHVLAAYRASLRAIRPQLVGAIAEDADRVLVEDGEGV